ncbi:hypothetical protein LIER_42423 [Lithospermum erythrorhizon]|uniref:F-box associated domain-containing protein n=1 Tax=Lithospermum erythrorhizon TaxID=34254 RepID=A0AAV3RT12_LITER
MHWFSHRSNTGSKSFIVIAYINITTYEYGGLLLPENDKILCMDREYLLGVGEFGGCIDIMCDYSNTTEVANLRIDVWIMKEYSNRDSWSKYVCIPWTGENIRSLLIFGSQKDEVIFVQDEKVIVYDTRNAIIRTFPL